MSCRYNFITDLGLQSSMTSQYFHLKSKIKIFFYVGIFLKFICAYLGICWPIFSQIEICYSWNNTLSVLLLLFFILMTSSWSKIQLKGISPNFASLRVMSMGVLFSSNHELTWHCSLCRILLIARANSLKFWYVVAETLLYVAYDLRFLNRCQEHGLIFDSKVTLQQNLKLRVVGMGKL